MLVPVKWLEKYVDISGLTLKEIEECLILTGSNIETVDEVLEGVQKVVVGRIEKIEGHPDAEKLIVMDVNVGEPETIQIVTGATNCFEGAYVPVALNGSWISGGVKIKKGKLRGVVSNGMLCSLEELGFDKKAVPKEFDNGILILDNADNSLVLGQPIQEVADMGDHVIEFEITPNRPDCLSMIGMARETAATFNRKLVWPDMTIKHQEDHIENYCKIEIKDPELCPRYAAKMIKDVKIGPSPLWLQMALMKAGMRPISNIVDITNYVMLEMGHPIHAFDFDCIEDKTIVVRRAQQDEVILTLDEQERKLNDDMLVIADPKKAVAIAGVMGGGNSDISESTKNILIEVANFHKSSVRKTSKDLGLRSEASSRFEKGVSTYTNEMVLNRVCHLAELIGVGTIVDGIVDNYPGKHEPVTIEVSVSHINKRIGINLEADKMAALLNNLEIETKIDGDKITCEIPECRMDLYEEHDIVEEVARLYGYDKIPMTIPKGANWGAKTNGQLIEDLARHTMFACGVNEITTYSFVSPSAVDMIQLPESSVLRNQVRLLNPLGEEYSAMRTTLVPNLLEVIARNVNRSIEEVKAFEIGNTFLPKQMPVTELPVEKKAMVIGIAGKKEDFFTLKGSVVSLLDKLGIDNYKFEAEKHHKTYHPGRCATIVWNNHVLGTMGEVHPRVLENFNIKDRAYVAELDFNTLLQITRTDRLYQPIPKFPAMTRDIAMIVKDDVTAGEILEVIKDNGGNILESVKLFDVYKGKQIEEGHKSMAYAMVFRHADKTLTDEEVNKVFERILEALKEKVNAELR
ncbi:MAG: phenylalanine--tRNA ligase subunit beta [Clostridia bacterium]|nr:phenylalanine--tRNA ligase subunit beta [Clostridia bacterium]